MNIYIVSIQYQIYLTTIMKGFRAEVHAYIDNDSYRLELYFIPCLKLSQGESNRAGLIIMDTGG